MSIRKIVGTETELRLDAVWPADITNEVQKEYLLDNVLPRVVIDKALYSQGAVAAYSSYYPENKRFQALVDEIQQNYPAATSIIEEHRQRGDEEEVGSFQRFGFSGGYTPSGFRLYIDGTHPEVSTPECASPLDLLCWEKAGEEIIEEGRRQAEKEVDYLLRLYKNNGDGLGQSWGAHENYLITSSLFKSLTESNEEPWGGIWMAFLVTRSLYSGAGKVGSDFLPSKRNCFFLSQRGEFFSRSRALYTTNFRPLINQRDISYVGREYGRRLHVITGDANRCSWSLYLKIGMAMAVLMMLEDAQAGRFPLFLRMVSPTPLRFFRLYLEEEKRFYPMRVETTEGLKRWNALDIQQWFLEQVGRWYARCGAMEHSSETLGWLSDVLEKCRQVLWALHHNPNELIGKVDWLTKKFVLEKFLTGQRLNWTQLTADRQITIGQRQTNLLSYLRGLDLAYHRLDQDSVFAHLEKRGLITALLPPERISRAQKEPPTNTRAWKRGKIIQAEKGNIAGISWDHVLLNNPKNGVSYLALKDPWEKGEN